MQPDKIFIKNYKLPIEEGDKLIRKLPSGLDEFYEVLDRGYKRVPGFPENQAFYEVEVRRCKQ